MTGDFVTENR